MKKNVIVTQSGGPSPAINASLQGVIDGCFDYPDRFGELYAAWHGVLNDTGLCVRGQATRQVPGVRQRLDGHYPQGTGRRIQAVFR